MSTKFNPGGIKINGDDKIKNYEDDVEKQLTLILRNPVGALVLSLIDADPKFIRIEPYTGGGCHGASAKPDRPRDGAPKDVKPYAGYGDGEYRRSDGSITMRDDMADYTGTGEGSDTRVKFTPGNYGTACGQGTFGSQPDEALFHELIHGLRYLSGRNNPIPTTSRLFLYMNEEEWFAILVTNIYMSVKSGNNRNLRANHAGHEELKAPLNSSEGLLRDDEHFKVLLRFLSQEILFGWGLAQIQAPYNPFAEWVWNQKKYKRP